MIFIIFAGEDEVAEEIGREKEDGGVESPEAEEQEEESLQVGTQQRRYGTVDCFNGQDT